CFYLEVKVFKNRFPFFIPEIHVFKGDIPFNGLPIFPFEMKIVPIDFNHVWAVDNFWFCFKKGDNPFGRCLCLLQLRKDAGKNHDRIEKLHREVDEQLENADLDGTRQILLSTKVDGKRRSNETNNEYCR